MIELELEEHEGVAPTLTANIAREDQVFVTAARQLAADRDRFGDKVVASEDDTRCEALSVASRASDGTMYLLGRKASWRAHERC